MNIWEEVYSRHKESETTADKPQEEKNQALPDSLTHQGGLPAPESFEEKYYRSAKPRNAAKRTAERKSPEPLRVKETQPQPPEQAAPSQPQEKASPEKSQEKPVKLRFVPRKPSDKSSVPYPQTLSKMSYHLSDIWANMLVETKKPIETMLFCSAARKEGNTFISFHMAMFLSKEYNMRVLYVDTNLNHATIPSIRNLPGLYSFVSEKKSLASLVVQTEYPGFYLLPSGVGKVAKNVTSNMLSRDPAEALIGFCRDNFDITIIDGQPLTSSAVMIELARIVDITLLVCRYGYSRYEVSRLAVDRLLKYGISSLGVIFNDRKFPIPQKLYRLMG